MHGLLRRLFAPRWQHPDAAVRREALARLDPQRPEQRQALQHLAQDEDSNIRLAALVALVDLQALLDGYAAQIDNEAWFAEVSRQLCGQTGHADLASRQALIETITDARLLNTVALQGDNLDLRLAALAQLSAPDDLIYQACHNGVAVVRHSAAERLHEEADLKRLLKEARRDRRVIRTARERLTRLRADSQWFHDQYQQRETLLTRLEQHARMAWEPLYGGRFRHLQREWEALKASPDSTQEARYQDACLTCRKTLRDHEAQEQARLVDQQRQEDANQTRDELLEGIEESLESICHGATLMTQDIASLRSQKQLLAHRWQALSDIHPASEQQQQRYARMMHDYERCYHAWERWQLLAKEVENALTEHDLKALQALTKQSQWPEHLTPPALLVRAREALASSQGEQTDATATEKLDGLAEQLDKFEQFLERGAFKSASRLHQRIKPQIEALSSRNSSQPLKNRLKKLGARLAELRDWRGFVAGPKREQLCELIDALANDTAMDEAALDRRHRQLVKEWKDLGDAAANREQSARFRHSSDRIQARLAPWRKGLAEVRQQNLMAREALCEQLETLLAQPAEDADPDVLRQIRDKARQQWRHYSPVPREQAETIGRRFGKVRHHLQALIDQRAHTIATTKRDLIEATRHLLSDETLAPRERATQAKALQKQWRSLGRAPKGEEQTLWQEFRQLCDQIFMLRDAAQAQQATPQQDQLDAMQQLIERLDSWQPREASEVEILEDALKEAATLEPLPSNRRGEGMQRRLSGIVRTRREHLNRLEVGEIVQYWRELYPLLNAHLAADAEFINHNVTQEVIAQAVVAFPLKPPFQAAHEKRNKARRDISNTSLDSIMPEVEEALARNRMRLSLLAMGRVRQRDEPLRLAIQVERLNEGLVQPLTPASELTDVLAELLAIGPISEALWQDEAAELDELLGCLVRLPPP
ncbi:DUF349 domain-containing protein [Halomonas sediminis]